MECLGSRARLPARDTNFGDISVGGERVSRCRSIAGRAQVSVLSQQLIEVSKLAPQRRGYAFEKFLHDLFAVYGLASRGSFRLTGE